MTRGRLQRSNILQLYRCQLSVWNRKQVLGVEAVALECGLLSRAFENCSMTHTWQIKEGNQRRTEGDVHRTRLLTAYAHHRHRPHRWLGQKFSCSWSAEYTMVQDCLVIIDAILGPDFRKILWRFYSFKLWKVYDKTVDYNCFSKTYT